LGKIITVSGVATQGRPCNSPDHWYGYVKSYKLAYSNDGQVFTEYLKGVILDGNIDRDTVVKHDLIPVIKARYVRIYPQTWHIHIALRFELFGCGNEGKLITIDLMNLMCLTANIRKFRLDLGLNSWYISVFMWIDLNFSVIIQLFIF